MKKNILLAFLVLVLTATVASAEIVESIIARVGDRIITRSEFQQRLQNEIEEIEAKAPPEQVEAIKKQRRTALLDEMISELVMKDRAEQIGVTISDQELNEAIGQLKAQYGIESDEAFIASLEEAGLTIDSMRERLRETIRTKKLIARELRSRSQLGDKELRRRYERERERYRLPERAEVEEIILLIPEDADAPQIEELERRAKQAYDRATAGDEFATLVSEFSEAPSKEEGGKLGIIAKGELLPELNAGVFSSDAGAIVGPIRTRFGFHILRVSKRLPSEVPAFDDIKEQLRKDESQAAYQRDLDAYLQNLRNQIYVVVHEDQIPEV